MTVQTEVSSTLKERAKDQYKGWKKPVKKIPFFTAVPFFKPFTDVQQGMDALIKAINKVKNDSTRMELAVIYGCLGSTLNEQLKDKTL